MQSATQSTLANLVEQHVTALIRESAAVNRHSKRCGVVSAANDDDCGGRVGGGGRGGNVSDAGRTKRRRLIHHDDVNAALAWRGSEKLYVSGVQVASPTTEGDAAAEGGKNKGREAGENIIGGLRRLLQNTGNGKTTVPSLLKSSTVPRVDLNAYLRSELAVRPPCELGMTLHWLAVDGRSPAIPMNEVWNRAAGGLPSGGIAPVLELDDDNNREDLIGEDKNGDDSSIRIRELQHRLLSEELQLYYARVTSAVENSTDVADVSAALRGVRSDAGIQELVPFLSRFVASGLMAKRNLHRTEYCRRLIRVFDAMLDNRNLHLDLHLHQMFTPVGTCIVAKKLCSDASPYEDHWSLREEAARSLAKACDAYGDRYTTMRPRIVKLLTQQALRADRPLATQYGGIVGISLFGPRAVDAFLLPLAREYWERWEEELKRLTNKDGDERWKPDFEREHELHMCQQALLDAVQVFVQNVAAGEQARRVDVAAFADVFGERLIPMRPDITDYASAIV
eukprot:CAMPEP_0172555466 /NCGR_PEP_ID=MMETSP1067-20121228/58434_1 /TAXON_ID=265564 ORGANISM="Thalassiosira punctigera, Strain Tpunct2005C2" /NCGR_SAMPLE_ID=MMETSP1067 /ASSEMBLY_ACC=CAM_ASM_000444 /LENGTH=508 /DNA_ID=CAMNT_0013343989 /DNA_START=11 /DNA_END=1537 /DNA_ORIENTATION=-